MTQRSTALSESSHSTSLLLRMWLLNAKEEKLKGGRSTWLPNWSSAVKKVLLVQPSSAAAERVFSLLSASFHEQQENALSDYLQASVMLQYKNRR